MHLHHKQIKASVRITERLSKHIEPHLHRALEIVYVTEGTLELGMGTELFHMEKGDLGFVFPDVIHHYQVFGSGSNKAFYIQLLPSAANFFSDQLQKYAPACPVIKKKMLTRELTSSLEALIHTPKENTRATETYAQIILAKCLPTLSLVDKQQLAGTNLVYQVVAYVSAHFKEQLSLQKMAEDLNVNKYTLSRVFSGTFHRNFSQYLNDIRMNYAVYCLESTNDTILTLSLESGFDSQRTFHRAFKERYHMTPSEYRKSHKKNEESP